MQKRYEAELELATQKSLEDSSQSGSNPSQPKTTTTTTTTSKKRKTKRTKSDNQKKTPEHQLPEQKQEEQKEQEEQGLILEPDYNNPTPSPQPILLTETNQPSSIQSPPPSPYPNQENQITLYQTTELLSDEQLLELDNYQTLIEIPAPISKKRGSYKTHLTDEKKHSTITKILQHEIKTKRTRSLKLKCI